MPARSPEPGSRFRRAGAGRLSHDRAASRAAAVPASLGAAARRTVPAFALLVAVLAAVTWIAGPSMLDAQLGGMWALFAVRAADPAPRRRRWWARAAALATGLAGLAATLAAGPPPDLWTEFAAAAGVAAAVVAGYTVAGHARRPWQAGSR